MFGVSGYVLVSMLKGNSANAVIDSAFVISKPYNMLIVMFWFSKSVSFSAVTLTFSPVAEKLPLKSCVLFMTCVSTVQVPGSRMVSWPVVVFKTSLFRTSATTVPLISTVVALASSAFSISSLVRLSVRSCSSSCLKNSNSWSVNPRVVRGQSLLLLSWAVALWLLRNPKTLAPRRRIRVADIIAAVMLLFMLIHHSHTSMVSAFKSV